MSMQIISYAGRYAIAQYDARGHNWIASMTDAARERTGCSQVSSRTVEGIVTDPCVRKYASLKSARRALRAAILDSGSLRPLRDLHAAGLRVRRADLAAEQAKYDRILRLLAASEPVSGGSS